MAAIELIDLSNRGLSKSDSREVAKWMAKAFAEARSTIDLLSSVTEANSGLHSRHSRLDDILRPKQIRRQCRAARTILGVSLEPRGHVRYIDRREKGWRMARIPRLVRTGQIAAAL